MENTSILHESLVPPVVVLKEQGIKERLSQPLMTGAIFVLLYWCVESGAHSFFFDGASLIDDMFRPDIHEMWMRVIVVVLLISYSLYSQNMVNRLKKTENALIDQKREALDILEKNPAGIILIDCASLKIAYANSNASQLIGAPPDTLPGRNCQDFFCKSEAGKCPVLNSSNQQDISENELFPLNNQPVAVLKSASVIQFKGRPHLLEAFFDITEKKKMSIALEQAYAELEQIFQTASVGMRLIDSNFNILKINQTFSLLSGINQEEAIGRKCHDVFSGKMCHTQDCSLLRVAGGDNLSDYEVDKRGADGSILTCNLTVTPFRQADGTIGVVESFKDITELKRVHNELKSERDRLHSILFHQFESVGIITEQYRVEFQNELLKEQTRGKDNFLCYEEFMGRLEPCRDCCMQRSFKRGTVQRFEFDTTDSKSYQHTYTPFLDNDGRWKAVVSRREVTEIKASEAAAINSERLASIGELAAGVAHEINNPINGIINYAQILVNTTDHSSPSHEISHRIISEGDRIAAIVASLLSFARRESDSRSLVNTSDLLRESLILATTQLKKNGITLNVTIEENLPPIQAAGQEIQQVFLNIISNSRYALNQKFSEGGEQKRLDIVMGLVQEDDKSLIRTTFTDSGTGIEQNLIEKVRNPFFSTKPKGKGTGLGLSISQKILEKHKGNLAIESVLGEYTRVSVDLPAHTTGFPVLPGSPLRNSTTFSIQKTPAVFKEDEGSTIEESRYEYTGC